MIEFLLTAGAIAVIAVPLFVLLAFMATVAYVAWRDRHLDREELADALTQYQDLSLPGHFKQLGEAVSKYGKPVLQPDPLPDAPENDVQTSPDQDARIQEQTEPLVRAYLANEMTERDLEQALLGVCENVQGEVTENDRRSIASGMRKLRSHKRLVRAMPGGTKAARKHARKGAK